MYFILNEDEIETSKAIASFLTIQTTIYHDAETSAVNLHDLL